MLDFSIGTKDYHVEGRKDILRVVDGMHLAGEPKVHTSAGQFESREVFLWPDFNVLVHSLWS